MKKHIVLTLLILLGLSSFKVKAQSNYYYYADTMINLGIDTQRVYIKFTPTSTPTQRRAAVTSVFTIDSASDSALSTPLTYVAIKLTSGLSRSTLFSDMATLKSNTYVMHVTPVMTYNGKSEATTDKFIVKLNNVSQTRKLDSLLYIYNDSIVKQEPWNNSIFIISCTKASSLNSLEQANLFHGTGLFTFSEPDFLILDATQSLPNDTYFSNQWALQNTGQTMADQSIQNASSGVDINVATAWQITTGDPTIKIADVDVGVDLTHPDLTGNLLPGFDATYGITQSQTFVNTVGAPTGSDWHGTATAGIAAASGNNSLGIAGVAYTCKLIPIRAGTSGGGFFSSDCANAIEWAWDPSDGDADVITNSWGGGSPSSLIDLAISDAVTYGRNGLGCVVVVSSGNSGNSSVEYPANNSSVLSVGASDEFGGLAGNFSTSPNKYSAYSNYGSGLDVVAPGGSVNTAYTIGSTYEGNIYTTVPPGSALDNLGSGYTSYMNATSASTPFAAGEAALILSVNQCLSYQSVINIIEFTCTKQSSSALPNSYPYAGSIPNVYCYQPGYPNGSWNDYLGYGIINVGDAVTAAYSAEPFTVNTVPYTTVGTPTGTLTMIFVNSAGGCPSAPLSAGTYFLNRTEISANITFPYTNSPVILATSNGWSAANPNAQLPYCAVSSVTNTSATLSTYIYGGSYPVSDTYIRFTYAVLNAIPSTDLYFQNQNVNFTDSYSAVDNIYAGYSVTSPTYGDYIVQSGGGNIGFHAGSSINLEPGFQVQSGGIFWGTIGPAFYPCTEYPHPKHLEIDSFAYNKYIPTASSTATDSKIESIVNYPNPFNQNTNLQVNVPEDENNVVITVTDLFGRSLITIKTNLKQGVNYVNIDGTSLSEGYYLYTVQTPNNRMTGKMVKIK